MSVSESAVLRWIRAYHVDPDDATQELHLWHLTGQQWAPSTLRRRIIEQTCARRRSLDAPITPGEPDAFGDALPAPMPSRDDSTERVWRALRYWMRTGVLTRTQAAVLWLHVCEGHSLPSIAQLAGGYHHTTVLHHYRQALERVRGSIVTHEQTRGPAAGEG